MPEYGVRFLKALLVFLFIFVIFSCTFRVDVNYREISPRWTILGNETVREVAKNAKKADSPTLDVAMSPVEIKCPMYQEFRRMNFKHPSMKQKLCQNALAYKVYSDGYPMCVLQDPFDKDLISIVRNGSSVLKLQCMNSSPVQIFAYGNDLISNSIRVSGNWERHMVQRTLGLALKIPETTFMDIGSNIGVYSIQAAKLQLPVVALDANIRNLLRLRLSLNAASLHATLVWNFIAVDQNLKYLSFRDDCNVGGAGRDNASLPDTVPVMPLRSERLASLIKTKNIVMKMDIQGGETEFLQTSSRLFSDFNVAAVQMEWDRSMIHGNDSSVIAQFFISRDYKAWQIRSGFKPLDLHNTESWGDLNDIIWVRKDFVNYL